MYCKRCGADVGVGYPSVQFCPMCGISLVPPQEPASYINQGSFNQPYKRGLKAKVSKMFPGLSFTRRTLPKNVFRLLTAGAVLCLLSMFMNWIAPYSYNNKTFVPRSEQLYKRNQYGDLKSIEYRNWYDTYTSRNESFGSTGSEMILGTVTFLIIVGITISLFYKPNNPMPPWTKKLPTGILIYFILFWAAGLIQALLSHGGPGLGVIAFPIGVLLLYRGNKRLKESY